LKKREQMTGLCDRWFAHIHERNRCNKQAGSSLSESHFSFSRKYKRVASVCGSRNSSPCCSCKNPTRLKQVVGCPQIMRFFKSSSFANQSVVAICSARVATCCNCGEGFSSASFTSSF